MVPLFGGLIRAVQGATEMHTGPTQHVLRVGDARDLSAIPTASVHLVVTSPPYADLKEYTEAEGQLGSISDYDQFLTLLDGAWRECLRVLVPGGRVACVVGDVCISRKKAGRHYVLPLSSDLQVRARHIGFDNLTPIRWLKVANIKLEASRSSRFLGKPNLPNGIVKNDLEHILFFRKPGGYRKSTPEQEALSRIENEDYTALVRSDLDRREWPTPQPRPPGALPARGVSPAHPHVQLRRRHRA